MPLENYLLILNQIWNGYGVIFRFGVVLVSIIPRRKGRNIRQKSLGKNISSQHAAYPDSAWYV